MNESEQKKMIREEVRRQVNVVLYGSSANSTGQVEDINDLFPGMPGITARPTAHPFGFVSRAAQGVISVVARVGEHFGNRMVIGHRDSKRPSDLEEGESCVYSVGGYRLVIQNGALMIGKGADLEPAVVGETLQTFLGAFLDEVAKHTHGAPGAPPTDAAIFEQLKTSYIENGKILAKAGGRF